MATVPTVTYNVSKAIREDLYDVMIMLNPYDTWFTTNSGDTEATGTLHEWLQDTLATPAENKKVEGADAISQPNLSRRGLATTPKFFKPTSWYPIP